MIYKKHLLTSLLILFVSSVAINTVWAQQKVKAIQNALSKNHVRLGEGSVLIVPPENFTPVSGLNGIMQESSNTSIIALEIQGNLEETSRMFGANAMRSKNIEVLKEEELTFNGYPGYFIEARQATPAAVYGKYVLSFGIDSLTVILNASFPMSKADSLGPALKKSVLSAVYSKFKPGSSQAAANYNIELGDSGFQLARSASNSLVYTTDGKMPTNDPEKTALLTTRSEGRLEFNNKVEFAADRLKQLPAITDLQIEATKEIEVNGRPAVEMIAYANDKYTSEKKLIYQLMVFAESIYYLVIGTCSGGFESNIEKFRKVALTIRLK